MKPQSLEVLIASLHALPGISRKQAQKIAYHLVSDKKEEAFTLANSIADALTKIRNCSKCGHLTENKVCDICQDKNRLRTLVIVETPLDVFKFEETQAIKPYYHVLNGLIDVSTDVEIEDLNISNLKERSEEYNEVILALSPNLEGIVTANYIKNMLKGKKVTQLAQGIPIGAAMEYVDELTLKLALDNRKEVK